MGDEEDDQETPFQDLDGHQLAIETAWVRAFIREARKREYTIENIVARLDDWNDHGRNDRADSVY